MQDRSAERQLSAYIVSLSYREIPADVVETITRAFVDTVGVTIAGSMDGTGPIASDRVGPDPDSATAADLLGVSSALPPESIALQVGTASHALDYDDLSWAMDGHPSVTLVPPLLALLGEGSIDGRDLITAYAAGFEVETAIAAPISPDHYEAGWHATATFGTFGATAAAASLLGLNGQQTTHALGAAASMVSGLKRNFGTMTKPLHAGLAARSGVTAARSALEGLTADPSAISGPGGFWDLYGGSTPGEFSIGESWELQKTGIHVKAYPSCYFTHTAIAATLELTADLDPAAIERISVKASRGAADALQHPAPETGLEGKFSMPHAVATAAVRDRVTIDSFSQTAIEDPEIQSVRERVEFETDQTLPYDSHAAVVSVETAGTHEDPLTDAELKTKFDECTVPVLGREEADRLHALFESLPSQRDIGAVLGPQT